MNSLSTNDIQYYIINDNIGSKIFKNQSTSEYSDYQITFVITEKNIKIIFNTNDSISFKINEQGIIGNYNLIIDDEKIIQNIEEKKQKNLLNQNDNNSEEKNRSDKLIKVVSKIKNKYKIYLEILIRIFFFQKELEKKIINFNNVLHEKNKLEVYLINNDWLEKFKLFFNYKLLESFLEGKDLNENIDEKKIEEIINDKPLKYFNKMINIFVEEKSELDKKIEDISQENYTLKLEKNKICELKFLFNYQIINEKAFELIKTLFSDISQYKIDLYIIENNKILLRFSDLAENNSLCDEIGIINENKIFVLQNILYYTMKIDEESLNKFISENSENISKDNDFPLKISDKNKCIIGYCFSMEYLINKKETEKANNILNEDEAEHKDDENENENGITDEENEINIIKNKREIFKDNFLNKFINVNKNKIKNKDDFNKEKLKDIKKKEEDYDEENKTTIESIIEIILLMNIFEKELDKKLNETENSNENQIEECILLKNEWIDKFQKVYINEEIKNGLNNITSEDINSNIKSLFSCIKNTKDYIDKINEAKLNISSDDIFYFDINCLSKMLKNHDIFYPKDFYIINLNIYEKLLKLFKIEETNELSNNKNNAIKYIINNGKIIFSYEYELNIEQNENINDIFYYNILICEKDKTSDKISPIVVQSLEDKKEERDAQFNLYTKTPFSLGKNVGDIDDGVVVQRPLKEKEHEQSISILIELYECIKNLRIKFKDEIKKKKFK